VSRHLGVRLTIAAVAGVLTCAVPLAHGWECIEAPRVVTSEVSVQVFDGQARETEPLAGVTIRLDSQQGRWGTVASATTGADGYVRFVQVTPGDYRVWASLVGFGPVSQPIRVVARESGPARCVVAALTAMCPRVCAVPAAGGPFRRPPKCVR